MTDLPSDVVDEVERLTRLAREAADEAESDAYRRERASILVDHGYTARVREDDSRDVLVCYPDEWMEEGTVQMEQVEDVDRGVEVPLSGPGQSDDWQEVADHNDAIVERVAADAEPAHGENARALADFASNHYSKAIGKLTGAELCEFRDEYFARNAFPSERQRELIEDSIELVFQKIDAECPSGFADSR